ncbi:F-box/kelch-repeat protein At3g06240 [Coffea arabica]|uniref:F-box/kelch-repeat protein At3g06240 n=1 Tax=Coffea arabica TaxID=13443 RepID=A0A6P6W4I4_COFAR|nr:F-box/kelch-repeat protein At3g06240-like [Coffea arabica]
MDLKRRRNSVEAEIEKGIKGADDQSRTFSASIMDIPEYIFIDILLRLPLKGILVCKCTCKAWRRLILSPHFAGIHYARSQTSLLIRNLDSSCVPRTLYLIDPSEMDLKSCLGCDKELHLSLDVKLRIPLRNPLIALQMDAVKKKRRVRLKLTDQKFRIVNSYNGFLCLSEPSANEPVAVCNPVTGEYVEIPEGDKAYENFVDCGFGFCPNTNLYKVIRIFDTGVKRAIDCPIAQREMYSSRMAEIHTLGTQSWENVGYAPSYYGKLTSPTYLNGNLHWLHEGWDSSTIILSFDFTQECFKNFPPPMFEILNFEFALCDVRHMSMGVLRGDLFLCHASHNSINFWVMEKYGVQDSWTKLAKIRKSAWEHNYMYHPINYLRCGSLLIFHYPKNMLIHYDLKSKERSYFKVCGTRSKCEAVSLIPSFFSFKEAVQENIRVFNIRSLGARIKLQGENKALYVREEDKANIPSDSSTYWSGDDYDSEDWPWY